MAVSAEAMLSKFRGCMLGALAGDCLGAPFEFDGTVAPSVINNFFKKLNDASVKTPYKQYTDDTAMTKTIAQSLIDEKKFNMKDLTKKFCKEYFSEPDRGYGAAVPMVFSTLKATKYKDLFAPAAVLFNGSGSYGNGGGMRVCPIALFTTNSSEVETTNMARDSALITHANPLGYNGAILQCLAVRQALHTPPSSLDAQQFVDSLITSMKNLHNPHEEEQEVCRDTEGSQGFVDKLLVVKELLKKPDKVERRDVVSQLGNSVTAVCSIPTAIYIFLRAQQPINGLETDSEFLRALMYSISLGGDTDTIASMAGSISGAYYGSSCIPEYLDRHCEGWKLAVKQADKLHHIVFTHQKE